MRKIGREGKFKKGKKREKEEKNKREGIVREEKKKKIHI